MAATPCGRIAITHSGIDRLDVSTCRKRSPKEDSLHLLFNDTSSSSLLLPLFFLL